MTLSDFSTYAGYFLGILIIIILAGTLRAPFKWIFTLALNSIVGCAVIYLINMLFSHTGFYIGINPLTAIFMGIFGIPGVAALAILRLIL